MSTKQLRQNRFDALRLVFALLVVIYHLVLLASLDPQSRLIGILAHGAALGVQGFFIISGALVYGSLERSKSLKLYAEKRIRRLYPAYFLVIIIPALASILISPTSALDALHYFAANAVFANFIHPELNAFFQGNPISAVNGALWTIKIEVMFYIALPILSVALASVSSRGRYMILAAIYIAAEIWRQSLAGLSTGTDRALLAELARQLPGQMSFFAAGMALWMTRGHLTSRLTLIGAAGAALLVISFLPGAEFMRAAGLAGIVAYCAWAPGPAINAVRFGDFSYGIYILHFPIIQTAVAFGLFRERPALASLFTIGVIFAGAALLWRFVEAPALRSDSHYKRKEMLGD